MLRGQDRGRQVVAAARRFLGCLKSGRECGYKNLICVVRESAGPEILVRGT
jgi:hypothetical protein